MSRLLWISFAVAIPLLAADDGVRTSGGMVAGAPEGNAGVRVYKGIPFAAPPVGELRWKAPQPAAAWNGVKQATEFGAVCMQEPYPQTSLYYSPLGKVSEDCLYLNVWSGAASAKDRRPVMVWIHGGGYTRGTGATPTYDGEVLARKGAVVVTLNYRLGVFGFLAHPELTKESANHASGNYGLLDQIAALEWVKKNIEAFGGDPKRVTIFGESAGSSAVNYLMASPLGKGLFQRAIGESGANFGPRSLTLTKAEQNGSAFGTKVGAPTLAALRGKSAEELLKAGGSFRACVDGWFLPESVSSIFEHRKQNDVPVIAGYNHDEGTTLSPWPADKEGKTFVEEVQKRYGSFAEEFLQLYPSNGDEQAMRAHYNSFRDQGMGWQMRTWVRMQRKSGKAAAYLYYFTRVPPGPESEKYGAYHASEIQYVFGTLSTRRPWEAADRKLSDQMSSYWVNFAATGNPNGQGLPKWPAYHAGADPSMVFGNQAVADKDINKRALDFFDRFVASQNGQGTTGGGN